MVSVIIPCYNSAGFIDRCLTSMKNQSYKDFEVILVDDYSTDGTVDILKKWEKSNDLSIQIFINTQNSGPAYSRKVGIENAKGEFIVFCDSDDWYDPNYIFNMVFGQKSNNADIIFCGYRLVFDNDKSIDHSIPRTISTIQDNDVKSALLLGIDSLCTLMIRKDIIKGIEMPPLRNGEDMAIIPLLIVKSKRFAIINQAMYNYYCRTGSASMTPSNNVIINLEKSFAYIESQMPDKYADITEYLGIKNYIYGALLNHFKISKDVSRARTLVNNFTINHPDWKNNRHIIQLPLFKRLFIWSVINNMYWMVIFLSIIHKHIAK